MAVAVARRSAITSGCRRDRRGARRAAADENVAVGAFQRRAGEDDRPPARRPGRSRAMACSQGLRSSSVNCWPARILSTLACGVKPVAILEPPAQPSRRALRRSCSCRSPRRPSRPARRAVLPAIDPPESRRDPAARRSRRRTCARRRAGSRLRTARVKIALFSAPPTRNSISRQEASAGKVRVTRGTKGSTCAFGTPTTQRSVSRAPDRRETARRYGRRGPCPSARDRTADVSGRARPRRRTLQFLSRKARRRGLIGAGGRGRNRMNAVRRRATIQKTCAPCHVADRVAGGTKRSSPMNQCTRCQGILLAIRLASPAIDRAASGSIRRSGRSRRGPLAALFAPHTFGGGRASAADRRRR